MDALTSTITADHTPTPEQRLWAAVIKNGLSEATNGEPVVRNHARTWIRSRAFLEVADLAGLEPEHAQRLALSVIQEHDRRNPPVRQKVKPWWWAA